MLPPSRTLKYKTYLGGGSISFDYFTAFSICFGTKSLIVSSTAASEEKGHSVYQE